MIKLPPFDLYAGNTADRNSTNFPKRGNALAYVDTEAGVFHVHVAGSWVALGGGTPEPIDDGETYGRKTDGTSSWVAVVPKDGGEYTGAVTISLAGTEYLMLDSPADTTSTPSVQFKRNGNLRWQIRQGSFTNNSLTIRRYNNSGTFQDTPIHLDDSTGYVGIQGVPSTSHVINGGVVFNEPGAAVNHRFEGATDANLLFLDGVNDRIGIGTGSPTDLLDVAGRVLAEKFRSLNTGNIADDNVYSFTPSPTFGAMIINNTTGGANRSDVQGLVFFRFTPDLVAFVKVLQPSTAIQTNTVVLSGTTGSDGFVTISAVAGDKIYIENRTGAGCNINITLFQ